MSPNMRLAACAFDKTDVDVLKHVICAFYNIDLDVLKNVENRYPCQGCAFDKIGIDASKCLRL